MLGEFTGSDVDGRGKGIWHVFVSKYWRQKENSRCFQKKEKKIPHQGAQVRLLPRVSTAILGARSGTVLAELDPGACSQTTPKLEGERKCSQATKPQEVCSTEARRENLFGGSTLRGVKGIREESLLPHKACGKEGYPMPWFRLRSSKNIQD